MKNIPILVISVLSAIHGSDCLAKTSYASFPVPAKGGTFVTSVHSNPRSLNPILMDTASDFELAANLFMSLIQIDSQTYQEFPGLCEKVEVSKDQKTYTYTLNKNAKWSDGTPVTSDDVEFTFKKMMDPTVYAAPLRGQFGGVTFEKIDQQKFKFLVSVPKFNTRLNLNTFVPVQKKQFENEKDFNGSKANLKPVGNGPYLLKTISRDQFVMLERDRNWWAKDLPDYRATANFDQIQFKVIQDMTLNYELFVKGGLDVSPITSEQFATQVNGSDRSQIGSNENSGKKMWAAKFPSSHPMGWFGVALNNRHPILSSVKVRQAFAQLVDYDAVISRAYFNLIEQSVSPFGSKSDNTAPELKSGVKKYKY
jgi:ABC-type oligopeptide transport system substrate-binding subunit